MNPTDASAGGRSSGSVPAAEEKSITETTSTKSTGPYDRAFQQNLIDGSVYPRGYKYPDGRIPRKPANWDEINHRLAQRRASLSSSKFSAGAHETFVDADSNAFKEKEVGDSVIPIIGGRFKDARCVSGGVPFRNMAPLTDGTLVPGNPDIYHGARPEQLDQQVRSRLHDHIVPSTQDDLPMLPNFFLAVKGPDGSLAVAERQACYDGALGARAMHALRSFGNDEPVYDENAYSVTSTYHGGQLKMFTSHMTQPTSPSDRAEYIMTQVNGWSMTGNPETFRQGATAFRNARDWTKEQRDQAIEKANMRQTGALC
ncbi:hypothetical protein MMC27_002906 [Xylographa pallens]|nr:hypothetical protein [Xylographa pallens]